jgi:uncharacterized protein involved in type VI secretion and phage assembly
VRVAQRAGERLGLDGASRWFGLHSGIVTDVADPDGWGRVRVRLPWALDPGGDPYEAWCRLVTLMAGAGRGVWFVPDVEDEVAVAFEGGDPRRPLVVGALWNGVDVPPERMGPDNAVRSVTSRAGIRIELHDGDGEVALTLETPGGQRVRLQDSPAGCTVEDAQGNRVVLESAGISIETAGTLRISASSLDVSAGQVSVNAGMSRFSGVAQADTVITNAVVSSSYTPGAGNVW